MTLTNPPIKRVVLIVLDSLGCGAASDAARFGDQDAHTLKHICDWVAKNRPDFALPNLSELGLGALHAGFGLRPLKNPAGAWGLMKELSPGKDTTTGHWELAGTVLKNEFPVFPQGFSAELMKQWCDDNHLPGYLCNRPASGTTVLEKFGEEHIASAKPIVYTSGDSVFQIACHEKHFGLDRLYSICKSARVLLDPLGVGRVIARPFVGDDKDTFKRTENRRDFSMPPPAPNMLDVLSEKGFFVAGVGKIEDIFAHRSVTIVRHTGRNETSMQATLDLMQETSGQKGLIFTNLIDFDQLYGHRRDPGGYAQALLDFDNFLPKLMAAAKPDDAVILCADHGNDPTYTGTDHTRENVPLLIWSKHPYFKAAALGEQSSFAVVARLVLELLGLESEVSKLKGADLAPSLISRIQIGSS